MFQSFHFSFCLISLYLPHLRQFFLYRWLCNMFRCVHNEFLKMFGFLLLWLKKLRKNKYLHKKSVKLLPFFSYIQPQYWISSHVKSVEKMKNQSKLLRLFAQGNSERNEELIIKNLWIGIKSLKLQLFSNFFELLQTSPCLYFLLYHKARLKSIK